jgi:hypothetical protein
VNTAWVNAGLPIVALLGGGGMLLGLGSLLVGLRSHRPGSRTLPLLGVTLTLAGPVAALTWASWIEAQTLPGLVREAPAEVFDPFPAQAKVAGLALTDRGRTVQLFAGGDAADLPADVREWEQNVAASWRQSARAIRLAPADRQSNCHGWTFADGRYWIRPESVNRILEDNGYGAAARPGPGDLAVYRNSSGRAVHSGVVQLVLEDGLVLVESKWGWGGRYLHPSEEHCYPGASCTFYRSSRDRHLLTGFESSPSHRGTAVKDPPAG